MNKEKSQISRLCLVWDALADQKQSKTLYPCKIWSPTDRMGWKQTKKGFWMGFSNFKFGQNWSLTKNQLEKLSLWFDTENSCMAYDKETYPILTRHLKSIYLFKCKLE